MTYSIITLETITRTVHGLNGTETITDTQPEPVGTLYREGNVCLVQGGSLSKDDPAVAPLLAKVHEQRCAELWKQADAYQTRFISSVAIGLLTIGVIQRKPKALAVMQWTQALWAEYYTRKAAILNDDTVSYSFDDCGEMPYSVPELQAEIL